MIYLLDTNAVVALLKNQPAHVRERLRRAKAEGGALAVSSIALFELCYGVARTQQRDTNRERLRLFLSEDLTTIQFDEQDAPIAGDLRRTLEAAGTPIGAYDLLIAAQALRTGATMVTANVAESARVHGLAWEDWTARADGDRRDHDRLILPNFSRRGSHAVALLLACLVGCLRAQLNAEVAHVETPEV